jgi:Flp pilus assembly protein TadD
MNEERNRLISIILLGLAVTLGVVAALWLILPRGKLKSAEDLYQQAEQQRQAGDLLGAEANLRAAKAKAPDDARVHFALGKTLIGLHRAEEARQSFSQAAKLSPSRDLLFQSGVAMLQNHREKAAEEFFQDLLQQYPQDQPALYQLGAIQSRQGSYAEAAKTFEALVAFAPNEAEAWNNLGFCYHNLGRSREAIQAVEKALALKPDFAEAKKNLEIIRQDMQAGSPPQK